MSWKGRSAPADRLSGDQILAKHDERYMPREVVEFPEETGPLAGRSERRSDHRDRPFRPRARARRGDRANYRAGVGRARRRSRPHGGRPQRGADPVRLRRDRLRGPRRRASDLGFFGPQRRREFAQRLARDLQDHRRLGEPRRLDAPLGADPGDLRRDRRRFRPLPAADAPGERARRAGPDQRRLPALRPADLEPVRTPRRPPPSRGAT